MQISRMPRSTLHMQNEHDKGERCRREVGVEREEGRGRVDAVGEVVQWTFQARAERLW